MELEWVRISGEVQFEATAMDALLSLTTGAAVREAVGERM
jgi:hypothetical protein